jgi:hypothetical protein
MSITMIRLVSIPSQVGILFRLPFRIVGTTHPQRAFSSPD